MTVKRQFILKNIGLHKAYNAFMLDCRARNLKAGTVRFYEGKLPFVIAFMKGEGVTHIGEIEPVHIRKFLVHLQEQGNNPGGQHAYARVIRTWLNFLVNEELLEHSPMNRVKMPRVSTAPLPAFSLDDIERLLSACKYDRDTAVVLFLLDTGVRASECVALNVSDVDLVAGEVRIRRGKGDKSRIVYAGSRTRRALRRYLYLRDESADDASPLWTSFRGGSRLSYNALRLALRRLGQDANVDHCHPHTFRRTFALWSLRAGMNIYALQALMGHADLTVLRRYLAIVESDLETAHREHGPVDNHL